MIMNVPHSGAYMLFAGAVSIASVAASAAVEIVKTRTERSDEARRRETRHMAAKQVEIPEIVLLLDTLDAAMTTGEHDEAAVQAICAALLHQYSKREAPYQVEGAPAVPVGDHRPDRPASPPPSESEPSGDDKEGLRTAGMLLIRIN